MNSLATAAASQRHRATEASPRAASRLGPVGSVSTVAGDFWSREARKAAAIRDIRDRFYQEWNRISSEMEAEIERIKREGV